MKTCIIIIAACLAAGGAAAAAQTSSPGQDHVLARISHQTGVPVHTMGTMNLNMGTLNGFGHSGSAAARGGAVSGMGHDRGHGGR